MVVESHLDLWENIWCETAFEKKTIKTAVKYMCIIKMYVIISNIFLSEKINKSIRV